jgi:hypothetical protein
VPHYLVETYLEKRAAHELAQVARRAREAAEQLSEADPAVRYLGAIAIVEDEMCFHLYAGPSAAAVTDAASRAAIIVERIMEAVHLGWDGMSLDVGQGASSLE